MNIFVVDLNPSRAARSLSDRHIVSQTKETAQMLCTAVNEYGGRSPYKTSYLNHPCNIWLRKSKQNFDWLKQHGSALAQEYRHRYKKTHKCEDIIADLHAPKNMPEFGLTAFAQVMPEECRVVGDAVAAYRKYYLTYKRAFDIRGGKTVPAHWTNREPPYWWNKECGLMDTEDILTDFEKILSQQ